MLKTFLQLIKIQTLVDRSLKITAVTPELSPEAMTELFGMQGKEIATILNPGEGKEVEAKGLPKLEGKSPSERLRAVIFVDWKENTDQSEVFDVYYIKKMETIIDWIKTRLPERNEV